MNKNSIIESIQNIAGVDSVSHLCISPESENLMVIEVHLRITPEEVMLRNYNAAIRRGQINDETTFIDFKNKLLEEVEELSASWNSNKFINCSCGFDASELADISHVCDSIALHYGIDLQAEKEAKMLYNEQRID